MLAEEPNFNTATSLPEELKKLAFDMADLDTSLRGKSDQDVLGIFQSEAFSVLLDFFGKKYKEQPDREAFRTLEKFRNTRPITDVLKNEEHMTAIRRSIHQVAIFITTRIGAEHLVENPRDAIALLLGLIGELDNRQGLN